MRMVKGKIGVDWGQGEKVAIKWADWDWQIETALLVFRIKQYIVRCTCGREVINKQMQND